MMKKLNIDSMNSIQGGQPTATVYEIAGVAIVVAIYDPPTVPGPVVHIDPEYDLPNSPVLVGLPVKRYEVKG